MSDLALSVQNISKRYRIGVREERHETFLGAAADVFARPFRNWRRLRGLTRFSDYDRSDSIIWALKDVSFQVDHGEVVGIIGANGAGKTTLLKILSRITYPTGGRAEIHGRVSSLLEVGTGFHPELTGRENVYLNGTILGMRKKEIDKKFDAIVDFSGIEKFIDTPAKRYSSGMGVRLAFAVSAFLEPEILLVDEVLSVGDAEFQKRCLGKMEEASASGRTVLLVSHQMPTINALCDRVLLFEQGQIKLDGLPDEVIPRYLSSRAEREGRRWVDVRSEARGPGASGKIRFTRWSVRDAAIGQGTRTRCLEPCEFHLDYEVAPGVSPARVSIAVIFKDALGTPLCTAATLYQNKDFATIPRTGTFVLKMAKIPFFPGRYILHLWCTTGGSMKGGTADLVPDAGRVEVLPGDPYGTGRMPASNKNGIYVVNDFSWSVREAGAGPPLTDDQAASDGEGGT